MYVPRVVHWCTGTLVVASIRNVALTTSHNLLHSATDRSPACSMSCRAWPRRRIIFLRRDTTRYNSRF